MTMLRKASLFALALAAPSVGLADVRYACGASLRAYYFLSNNDGTFYWDPNGGEASYGQKVDIVIPSRTAYAGETFFNVKNTRYWVRGKDLTTTPCN